MARVKNWGAVGVEPPAAKLNEGWQEGERPPAEYFNWFFNQATSGINGVDSDLGDRSALKTTDKGSVVAAVNEVQDKKVDKVTGKGLSTNDYTTAEKNKLAGISAGANNYVHPASHPMSMITGLDTALNNKVDKVTGKGLSENDFTDAEKAKLAGIEAGATNYVHPATHPFTMITGAPTSYPANGGNADTVDGKHASDFAAAGSAKKYVTLVVGTTASGHTAADVDYLCDGTADDVEINAAIQALPENGGKIVIREGTYNLSAGITIDKTNIVIEGMGDSTVLKRTFSSGGGNYPSSMILVAGANAGFYNLTIDGNYPNISNSANLIPCIYLDTTVEYFKANKVTITKSKGESIENLFGQKAIIITDCCFLDNQAGMWFDAGTSMKQTENITITNNYFYNILGICIYAKGDHNIVSNNVIYNDFNSQSDGIVVNGNGVVTGNTLSYATLQTNTSNIVCGIVVGSNSVINNNSIINYNIGMRIESASQSIISANNILAGTSSIKIESHGTNNIVLGNMIWGKNISNSGTGNLVINNKYN